MDVKAQSPTLIPNFYPLDATFSAGLLGRCFRDPLNFYCCSTSPHINFIPVITSTIFASNVFKETGRSKWNIVRRIEDYQQLLDILPQQSIRNLHKIADPETGCLYMVVCIFTQAEIPFQPRQFDNNGSIRVAIGNLPPAQAPVNAAPQVVIRGDGTYQVQDYLWFRDWLSPAESVDGYEVCKIKVKRSWNYWNYAARIEQGSVTYQELITAANGKA